MEELIAIVKLQVQGHGGYDRGVLAITQMLCGVLFALRIVITIITLGGSYNLQTFCKQKHCSGFHDPPPAHVIMDISHLD